MSKLQRRVVAVAEATLAEAKIVSAVESTSRMSIKNL